MAGPLTIQVPGFLTGVKLTHCGGAALSPRPGSPAQAQPAAADKARADFSQQAAQMRQAVAALHEGAAKLVQLQEQLIKEAEQQMLDLSLDIARKVLMQEIQASRYEIDPIVKEALGRVPLRSQVLVYLNPEDLARCELAQQAADGTGPALRFVGDASVAKAHCLLEASDGTVTSNVEERLEDIELALKSL